VVRNDAGVREGDEISMFYDPMIAKLSTWGPDRGSAIGAMARALEGFHIEGLGHNIPFLSAVMDQERFASGRLSTNYIKDEFPDGFHGLEPTEGQLDLMVAAACAMHVTQVRRAAPGQSWDAWTVIVGPQTRTVSLGEGPDGGLDLTYGDGRRTRLGRVDWRPGRAVFRGELDGRGFACQVRPAAEGYQVRHRAASATVLVLSARSAELHRQLPPKPQADTSRQILSPMPGLIVSLDVSVGQEVKSGQAVAVIEAMKMQNIIRAERDGAVTAVHPAPGDSVAADEVIIELA